MNFASKENEDYDSCWKNLKTGEEGSRVEEENSISKPHVLYTVNC